MSGKITILILDENEIIIETITIKKGMINSFEQLKKLIQSKIDIKDQIVEYYIVDDLGNRNLINSNYAFINYKNADIYKVKIISKNIKDDLSLSIFDLNTTIDKEITNDVKESLICWICLKDITNSKPFFCPNINCLKGVHLKCLKQTKDHETYIRCICGNIYDINEYKSNKLINDLTEIALKSNKEKNNKINYLENKLKEYESIPEKCKKHQNDFLVHYCYDCAKEFCGTCLLTESNKHKNHRLIDLNTYKNIKKIIKNNNKKYEGIINVIIKCRKKINLIKRNKTKYLKTLQKVYNNIKIQFDNSIEKINELIERIKIEYKDILNFQEKVKQFYNSLGRNKYNELKSINEFKIRFRSFKKNKNFEDKLAKELKNIDLENNNISNNFKKVIEIENIFKTIILKYDNDDKYVGELKKEKFNGKGIRYYSNGNIYEGDFKNDLREGKGIYYFKSGERYEGEFKNGNFDGKGVFYHNNGEISIGSYKAGKKIGKHNIILSNGKHIIKQY